MLVTNLDKVILHLPRCAGSSIRWALMRAGVEYKYSCEHANIINLPEKFKLLERVAFTRHPVSWYESWYSYTKMRSDSKSMTPNSVWCHVLSNGFTLSIDEFIKNALDLKTFMSNGGLARFKTRIQHVMMNHYLCRYASYWDDISALQPTDFDTSLYSWYIKTLGIDTATTFKMETQLAEGLKYICPGAKLRKQNACHIKHKTVLSSDIILRENSHMCKFEYTE